MDGAASQAPLTLPLSPGGEREKVRSRVAFSNGTSALRVSTAKDPGSVMRITPPVPVPVPVPDASLDPLLPRPESAFGNYTRRERARARERS